MTPQPVPKVETKYRRIVTALPVPESLPILEDLRKYEPVSMTGQPLVVWDRAEGVQVYDRWGNMWLDFSSGVLVSNAGHGREEIVSAIVKQARHPLLHNYCFPSEVRAKLVKRLAELTPPALEKVFLLTTGAETIECAIKLARTYGQKVGGSEKIGIVSFQNAFHGRTLGAQMVGGIPALKEWISNLDPCMWQVPFPDGFRCKDTSFDLFLQTLHKQGVKPQQVAGVLSETYQGAGASFAPPEYMQALRAWCDEHKVVLILDEVQAAFGRTGKLFGFEHYGVVPDLICLGKGISSSLPISAIIGTAELMGQYPPGSMTSTHTGNPVCCAAALANIEAILKDNLVEHAARVGDILHAELRRVVERFPNICGSLQGKGLVAGLHIVKHDTIQPDGDMAFDIVRRCVGKGLLLFSPVGFGAATIKINPPLVITEQAVKEGVAVLEEAIAEAMTENA